MSYIDKAKSVEWETPLDLFQKLDAEFHFDTDVCATADNAKCKHYYTKEQDGLKQTWTGTCWCNPPYGREITKWVQKASESDATTVMLVPARTDTRWFHDYVYGKTEMRFLKGRLKFGGGSLMPRSLACLSFSGGKPNELLM